MKTTIIIDPLIRPIQKDDAITNGNKYCIAFSEIELSVLNEYARERIDQYGDTYGIWRPIQILLCEYRAAKNDEICANHNGLYSFSSKDSGRGLANVVVAALHHIDSNPDNTIPSISNSDLKYIVTLLNKKIYEVDLESEEMVNVSLINDEELKQHGEPFQELTLVDNKVVVIREEPSYDEAITDAKEKIAKELWRPASEPVQEYRRDNPKNIPYPKCGCVEGHWLNAETGLWECTECGYCENICTYCKKAFTEEDMQDYAKFRMENMAKGKYGNAVFTDKQFLDEYIENKTKNK